MLDQSSLTSTVQLEALRLLSEWWDGLRSRRPGRSRRPAGPRGAARARLDERLAQPS